MEASLLWKFEATTDNVDFNCNPDLFKRVALRALIIVNRMRAYVQSNKEM